LGRQDSNLCISESEFDETPSCTEDLLGFGRSADGLDTGLIPLDNIVGRPTMARGIIDSPTGCNTRRLFLTLAPLLGLPPIRKRFKERAGRECVEVIMGLDGAPHILRRRQRGRWAAR
jgi:hypothetical protein